MKKASGKEIQVQFTNRRPGDVASVFANSSKAEKELNWKAHFSMEKMCEDAWRWQSNNPNGYR